MRDSIEKIEDIITEIENVLANAKPKAFSSTDVYVNREDMENLLRTLRERTPEEVGQYKKMIAQKEAIIADSVAKAERISNDAKANAHALLEQATQEHNQMISEHEVYLRAQARADEQVNMAMNQAQSIVDRATMEANALKDAANRYMEEVLQHLAKIISTASQSANANYQKTMQNTQDSFSKLMNSLGEYENIIQDNIKQLHPEEVAEAEPEGIPNGGDVPEE